MTERQPMTPPEFDAACRILESECPYLRRTSGYRNAAHNKRVGGAAGSKHVIGMASDYAADSVELLKEASVSARALGMWVLVHDKGSGIHLHVQGLAPGAIVKWWTDKYLMSV